jgi:poly(3-hydroxybutyrate) depolymerase
MHRHSPSRTRARSRRTVACSLLAAAICLGGCSGDDPAEPDPESDTLDRLPPDSGGQHLALARDPDTAGTPPYGCWLYLPGGWQDSPAPYPLLVFLHGAGERGDSHGDPAALDAVLRNGPPRLIAGGQWDPPHPLIVVSPQCHDGWWDPVDIRELLEWVDQHYPVDRTRIYLSGLSMGGYGTWGYLARFGAEEADPLALAAAAPICGGGAAGQAAAQAHTPIWAFHGTSDGTVPPAGSVALVKAIGALQPEVPPRLTLYDGVGHDSWSRTYDGSGQGEGLRSYPPDPAVDPWLVPYAPDLYAWFFSHRR